MLATEPDAALVRRLGMAGGLTVRLVNQGLAALLGSFFTWMFDLKVFGREGLGDRGYILCPNHGSYLDGFLLAYAVPGPLRCRLFSLGYSGYFDVPVIRSLLKLLRVIPVDSTRNVVAALQMSAYILKQGQLLAIFPEGVRTPTGEVGQFKKGVAILARELEVKLVPVYIQGSFAAWPPGVSLPRPHPIRIFFGREHSWQELKEQGLKVNPDAADYDAIRFGLREEVMRLKETADGKKVSIHED